MELPICNGTYSNNCDVSEVQFLDSLIQVLKKSNNKGRPFYPGLCNNCYGHCAPEITLQRCGGCQLVSYCSRSCQKDDWIRHKRVCKEFPLVKGKNVLQSKGPWKTHIAGLRERAARLTNVDDAANYIPQPTSLSYV